MSAGYIYVLSNPLYSDYVFIGASKKTPTEKATELYSEGLLFPFKVEKAKSVQGMDSKLVSLHKLLNKFGERPNPDRDFFKIPADTVDNLFDLVDGENWIQPDPETSYNILMEKVTMIMKNENPKMNEFQLAKLKMRVTQILKQRNVNEPTLENVREAMDIAKRETPFVTPPTVAPSVQVQQQTAPSVQVQQSTQQTVVPI
jgi:hypothetical protein